MSEPSSILIVHSRRINNCSYIKRHLEKSGILSVVAPAKRRIDCSSGDCFSDFGCYIKVKNIKKEDVRDEVWKPLNDKFKFTSTRVFHRK